MSECLIDGGSFFEGPRWHEGAWWVSDFYRHHVLRITPDGKQSVVAEVPAQPSGLGFLPDGRLLIVSMKDRRILRREHDGSVVTHADLSDLTGGHVNDMVVDGAWALIGSTNWDARSLRLNFEYNLECFGETLGQELQSIADEKIQAANPVTVIRSFGSTAPAKGVWIYKFGNRGQPACNGPALVRVWAVYNATRSRPAARVTTPCGMMRSNR